MSWFDGLLWPIMWVVAWIMVKFHALFDWLGLDPAGGAAWSLSIVGLVIVIRIALIPLFFRQIRASRGLQLIQPEMQAIQKKYKGKTDPASREAMSRETMALYRKHNTNPFASCLPILLQSPIFFALFRVLNSLTLLAEGKYPRPSIGPLTQELAAQAESATIFGAPLSGAFARADGNVNTQIVTIVLIVAMSVTTFTTQRQLTMKNMPKAALEGPMAQQQKMLLYAMPLIFAFSGVQFPIGVLIYWTTTNLWSMGQQFYTIRRMPAPGSQAEAALKERQARKAVRHGGTAPVEDAPTIEEAPRGGQRQQPVRKDRAKGKPQGSGGAPGSAGSGSGQAGTAASGTVSAAGAKAAGAKASGAKAAGAKPAGAKPSGGKPTGSRPTDVTRAADTGASSAAGATDASSSSSSDRQGGPRPVRKRPPEGSAPRSSGGSAGSGSGRPARADRPTIEEGSGEGAPRPRKRPQGGSPRPQQEAPGSSSADGASPSTEDGTTMGETRGDDASDGRK
jgi:YidC/Oxa1 family membrane protein insertase